MKKVTVEELLKPYECPDDPINSMLDECDAARRFRSEHERLNRFKPIPIADCHIARTCENCFYNKGKIQELGEFVEYGLAYYYGFIVCTADGREVEKCKLTTHDSVCSRHKFRESEGSFNFKIRPRDKVLPLRHLERCIAQRVEKERREKEAAKVPCGTNGADGGEEK